MDLQEILVSKIGGLGSGVHSRGLNAVRSHIDAAIRHFERGPSDETAFTDSVYRCNQAFEGSIKEAYRVLTGKDPSKTTPAKIESYLIDHDVLKRKVLDSFTNYRQEWRNPSTHDYMLDFDQDESLLAIVSVTAFAIALCGQISSKLAFDAAAAATTPSPPPTDPNVSLRSQVESKLQEFAKKYRFGEADNGVKIYTEFEGALAGFLTSEFSNQKSVKVDQGEYFDPVSIDVLVSSKSEKIAIETRVTRTSSARHIESGLRYAEAISAIPEISHTIVLAVSAGNEEPYIVTTPAAPLDANVSIIAPKGLADKAVPGRVATL